MPNRSDDTPVMPAPRRTLIRRVAGRLGLSQRPNAFTDSGSYWEQRYRFGGNSGAGSYGQLARFKAEFLNGFVTENQVRSVIEFGSGDGAQLALAEYPSYVGVDVSPTALDQCRALYRMRAEYRFIHADEFDAASKADLTLSLDVIYHLVEDSAFEQYMERLFDSSLRFVIIYSSNKDEWPVPHVRHRQFSDWVAARRPSFDFITHHPNAFPEDKGDPDNTSFADFYVYQRR